MSAKAKSIPWDSHIKTLAIVQEVEAVWFVSVSASLYSDLILLLTFFTIVLDTGDGNIYANLENDMLLMGYQDPGEEVSWKNLVPLSLKMILDSVK